MIRLSLACVVVFAAGSALATKYVRLDLSSKVEKSSMIVLGQISALSCIDEAGRKVAAGKKCTAPGSQNQKSYEFKVTKVLKDNSKKPLANDLPQTITFKFASKSHTSVPADNYASELGQEKILYLTLKDDKYHPVHPAFYFDEPSKLSEVQKLVSDK